MAGFAYMIPRDHVQVVENAPRYCDYVLDQELKTYTERMLVQWIKFRLKYFEP